MELKFSKEQTIKILEKYYQEEYNFSGKVTITASEGIGDYGCRSELGCILDMKITGSMDFMGDKISCKNIISEENVEEAFKFYLEKAGHEVNRINLENGLTNSSEGYGLAEHTVTKAYFSGVTVMTKEKIKKIGGK